MVRLTKAQRKDRERVEAWLEEKPFKENARDKNPQVPNLGIQELLIDGMYVPENISDGGKFYTPPVMAQSLWEQAHQMDLVVLRPGMTILDPCAGIGNLLYPIYPDIEGQDITIHAFELDNEAARIGQKLFPSPILWYSSTPFSIIEQLEGQYDLVIMNPPINTKWGTMHTEEWAEAGAVKSEHLFLEMAIRALKPGGILLCIAPYNYIDKLPKGKGVKAWFEANAHLIYDLGELPGEFRFTKMRAHGFAIQREPTISSPEDIPAVRKRMRQIEDKPEDEVIRVGGDSIKQSEIEDEPHLDEQQFEFDLLPPEPPEPLYNRLMEVEEVLESIRPFTSWRLPSAEFKRSVQTWGIREPIILTRDDAGNTRLRDGRRRLQTAIDLGMEKIPIKVYDLNLISGAALTLDSNTQRSSNPISEYEAIVEMLTEAREQGKPITEHDICIATGMPVQTIRKRMKLVNLHDEIMEAISEKKIAFGVAEGIATLPIEQQDKLVEVLHKKGRIKGADVAEIKKVKQSKSFTQLSEQILSAPPIEMGHVHDFQWYEESFRLKCACACGRVVDPDEIKRTLNTYVD